ncbi:MAG: methyltransferase domain-containing protein [Phycisphaerales bacterium]|nr:methyltransferase domain-containing protein [Phycisphaerales bacterium]
MATRTRISKQILAARDIETVPERQEGDAIWPNSRVPGFIPFEMPDYIHGTAPDERSRLSALNNLLNSRTLAEIAPKPGDHVLDIGSGLGQLSRAIASATQRTVIGIEYSPDQIAEADRQAAAANESHLVEFRQGDAANPPLSDSERGAFDLAHTRFVLEHVKDPLAVVRAMVAAIRPGGRIVISDDDHDVLRLHPEPPGLRELWNAYIRLYERSGMDPYVGRRLIWLLKHAGAQPTRNTWVWFGACSGNPEFEPIVRNLIRVVQSAREQIIQHELLEADAFDSAIEQIRVFGKRDDAAVWFAMALAEGNRPL